MQRGATAFGAAARATPGGGAARARALATASGAHPGAGGAGARHGVLRGAGKAGAVSPAAMASVLRSQAEGTQALERLSGDVAGLSADVASIKEALARMEGLVVQLHAGGAPRLSTGSTPGLSA